MGIELELSQKTLIKNKMDIYFDILQILVSSP